MITAIVIAINAPRTCCQYVSFVIFNSAQVWVRGSWEFPDSKQTPLLWMVLFFGGVAVGMLAISSRSFWIDECSVAWLASLPSLEELWRSVVADRTTELQTPFYTFFIWCWEKAFGHGEWVFRVSNVPWFAVGLTAGCAAAGTRLRWAVAVVLLASPFAWFKMDEARSYAMQLGLSLLVGAALVRLSQPNLQPTARERLWFAVVCGGGLALSASSMMAMIWFGGFLSAWLWTVSWKHALELAKRHMLILGTNVILGLGLGCYYLWTVKIGARGYSPTPARLAAIPLVAYELCGFLGLGPSRLALRSEETRALWPYLPILAVYGALVLLTMLAGWRCLKEQLSARVLSGITACLLSAAVVIFLAGVISHFRVQGRHFTPLLGPLALLLGAGVFSLWTKPARWNKSVAAGFVLVSLVSCFSLRFASRHGKDDYRTAAAIGAQALAKGEQVWWSADPRGALVYGMPVATEPQPGKALVILNPSREFLNGLNFPDVVIASKADLYDNAGALLACLAERRFKKDMVLTAFTVWRRE